MRGARRGVLLAAPVLAAALLALALLVVAVLASRALAARDVAVREGMLARLLHALESELREAGPEAAAATLDAFLAEHRGSLLGVEVRSPAGTIAAAGELRGEVVESPLALGRGWGIAMWGGRVGPGPGRQPRLLARLAPRPGLGRSPGLAVAIVAGSLLAGLALIGLAARGLAAREGLARAAAERERLETLALAGAGLAHRIRNPLGAVKGTAQLLVEALDGAQRGRAERIVAASERIELVLDRLLSFARPPETHPEAFELGALVREVVARAAGPVAVFTEPVRVVADPAQVEEVLEELLANARAFDAGELEVRVARRGAQAALEVCDRGPGPQVEPARAFAPWVTSRPEGTGLGLAIARTLARGSGGELELRARDGGGAVALLTLPVAEG